MLAQRPALQKIGACAVSRLDKGHMPQVHGSPLADEDTRGRGRGRHRRSRNGPPKRGMQLIAAEGAAGTGARATAPQKIFACGAAQKSVVSRVDKGYFC